MKYRKLDANGDYIFGGSGEFHIDTPEGVAQAIKTRLLLMTYEWFLDSNEGTHYSPDIIGYGTAATRDPAVIDRILGTPGVQEILKYSSSVDAQRVFRVNALVQSIHGIVEITQSPIGPIPVNPPGPTPSPPPPPPPAATSAFYLFHFQENEFDLDEDIATDQTGGTWDIHSVDLNTVDYKFGSAALVGDGDPDIGMLIRTSESDFERLGRNVTIFDGWVKADSAIFEDFTDVSARLVDIQTQRESGEGSRLVVELSAQDDEIYVVSYPLDDTTSPAEAILPMDEYVHIRVCLYFGLDGGDAEDATLKIWVNGEFGDQTEFAATGSNTFVKLGPEIVVGPFYEFIDYLVVDELYGQFGALNPADQDPFTPPDQEWPPSDVPPIPPAEAWNYEDYFDDFGVGILSHVPADIPENCTGWANSSPEFVIDAAGGVAAQHSGLYLFLDGVEQPPENYPDTVIQFRWDHREPANYAIASIVGANVDFDHMFEVQVYSQDYPVESGKVVLLLPPTLGGDNVEVGTSNVGNNDVPFQLIFHGSNVQLFGDGNLLIDVDLDYTPIKYPQYVAFTSTGGEVDGSDKTFLTVFNIFLTDDHA